MVIMSETNYAKEMIESGNVGRKPSATLFILAKYYLHGLNFNDTDCIKTLHGFLSKNYPLYDYDRWNSIIVGIVKKAAATKLKDVDEITIYKEEIDTIRTIGNKNKEYVMFTILVLAKINDSFSEQNNGWVNASINDIFNLAHVKVEYSDRKFFIINELYQSGLIGMSRKNTNTNIRVNFIGGEEIALKVDSLKTLHLIYEMYFSPDNYAKCDTCHSIFRKNKNQKLCNKCRKKSEEETKEIKCEDCGKLVTIHIKNNKTTRCVTCQKIYRNSRSAIWMFNNRNKSESN